VTDDSADDPLTPVDREKVDAALRQLRAEDKVFTCGICGHLVDVRFVEQHIVSHS
jgi:hypothetical protein